jgi:hypothetical protein
LYAFWGAAPAEIIHFLLNSYQSLYPDHVFNWTMMVETMGRCDTPKEQIENLLRAKQMHFHSQPINWEYLLEIFAQPSCVPFYGAPNLERLLFFMCGMSDRVEALAFQVWRDHITNMIQTADYKWMEDNSGVLRRIRQKIAHFDDKLAKLKAFTSILELAIWKMEMNEKICQDMATQIQKNVKTDESSIRQQCRITCGADVIISHVLPFLT